MSLLLLLLLPLPLINDPASVRAFKIPKSASSTLKLVDLLQSPMTLIKATCHRHQLHRTRSNHHGHKLTQSHVNHHDTMQRNHM
jgi:hypothetical protein